MLARKLLSFFLILYSSGFLHAKDGFYHVNNLNNETFNTISSNSEKGNTYDHMKVDIYRKICKIVWKRVFYKIYVHDRKTKKVV